MPGSDFHPLAVHTNAESPWKKPESFDLQKNSRNNGEGNRRRVEKRKPKNSREGRICKRVGKKK